MRTHAPPRAGQLERAASTHGRGPRIAVGAVAAALVLAALRLPLWVARLLAPQYPDGLELRAYGGWVTGDVEEIDLLNHYVGLRAFNPDDVPEMALWPLAIAVALGAVVVWVLARRRLWRRLAVASLWLLPVGVLAIIQFRLWEFGQDVDPGAPLRLEPFVPRVVGPTEVWNFTTWARPGLGLAAIVVAALLLTVAPKLIRSLRSSAGGAGLVLGIVLTFTLAHAPPAAALEGLPLTLDAAPAGAVIDLPPGTYRGGIVIDRPVHLRGQPGTVLQGDGTGTVLEIRAPGTIIEGLEVTGSGPGPTGSPAGIRVIADGVEIRDVLVTDAYIGIALDGVRDVRLISNTIRGRADAPVRNEGHATAPEAEEHGPGADPADGRRSVERGDGISLWDAENVLVRGNDIADVRDGVFISFGAHALIDGNEIGASRYGVHSMFADDLILIENRLRENLSGAVLMYGGPVLVLRNELLDNRSTSTGFGLLLKDVEKVEAIENRIARNRVGVHIDGPAGTATPSRLAANTIARNEVGVALYPSAVAVATRNAFAANLLQVSARGGELAHVDWQDRGSGNYWSTYQGYDAGAGIGAFPHREGGSVDRALARSPALRALATSPALQLVRAVEDRWAAQSPILEDPLPLTQPHAPPLPTPPAQPLAMAGLAAFGGATTVLATASAVRALRHTTVRRPVHA